MDPQRQASDPGASAWVSASAGTGKTHVLTNRVLRLMLSGARPQGILCLTFTKAAAAEMANRIYQRLGRWTAMTDRELVADIADMSGVLDTELIARARRLFATVLDVPGGLKIQTIHSFCQSLLGRFPLEAGIAPHFQAIDERTAGDYQRQATDTVLARARRQPGGVLADSIAVISGHGDETAFLALLARVLGERGKLDRLFGVYGADIADASLRQQFGLDLGDSAHSLIEAACLDEAFDGGGLRAAAEALATGSKTDRERAYALSDWLASPATRVGGFASYQAQFLAKIGTPRSRLMTKKAAERNPGALSALETEASRLEAVGRLIKLVRVAEASKALALLAGEISGAYAAIKRTHGALDYDDLILNARDLLNTGGAAAWVLYKLDGGIDHILIDEAQDTNPEQWQVVAGLAEEFFAGLGAEDKHRTIFAVGDPKQSIYSFQRADPEAFEHWRGRFKGSVRNARFDFRDVELTLSYRSTAAVLSVVDEVFRPDPVSDGLMFAGRAIVHQAYREGQAGRVELWPPEKPRDGGRDDGQWAPPVDQQQADDPSANLAARIADQIKDWLDNGEILEARARPVRAGDILILVRRRGQFVNQIVSALKARGIAVAGADRMMLTEQLAVMDLIALGRFALLPDDDFNLAIVLKGPLVGLDDDDLFELARGRKGSLWRALKDHGSETSRFGEAALFLSEVLNREGFLPPHEFYADLLARRNGRRKLMTRLGSEAGEPIDEFLALALEYQGLHPPSLQGFLHWIEAGETEIKRDMEQGRDEVRVMTVHGAKGLQAPIVFLPDTCQVPTVQSPLMWFDDGTVPIPVWTLGKANEVGILGDARAAREVKQMREYRRLLYVAMTRAEDRLYIAGWETSRARASGCWYDLVEQALTSMPGARSVDSGGRRIVRLDGPQVAAPSKPPAGSGEEVGRGGPAPDWAARLAPDERPPSAILSPSRLAEPPARGPLAASDDFRFVRGNLIHRLLQTLPGLPVEDRLPAAGRLLAKSGHGLDPARIDALVAETLGVLDDPDSAAIFAPGGRAEVAVAGTVAGVRLSGQIDRLLVTDHKVLIVDFKTNRAPPRSTHEVPGIYLRQIAAYRAILAEIYPKREIACGLLWTDGPKLMWLEAEALDHAWSDLIAETTP